MNFSIGLGIDARTVSFAFVIINRRFGIPMPYHGIRAVSLLTPQTSAILLAPLVTSGSAIPSSLSASRLRAGIVLQAQPVAVLKYRINGQAQSMVDLRWDADVGQVELPGHALQPSLGQGQRQCQLVPLAIREKDYPFVDCTVWPGQHKLDQFRHFI